MHFQCSEFFIDVMACICTTVDHQVSLPTGVTVAANHQEKQKVPKRMSAVQWKSGRIDGNYDILFLKTQVLVCLIACMPISVILTNKS